MTLADYAALLDALATIAAQEAAATHGDRATACADARRSLADTVEGLRAHAEGRCGVCGTIGATLVCTDCGCPLCSETCREGCSLGAHRNGTRHGVKALAS